MTPVGFDVKCDEQGSTDYGHLAHGNHMMDNGSLNHRVKSRRVKDQGVVVFCLCLPLANVSFGRCSVTSV